MKARAAETVEPSSAEAKVLSVEEIEDPEDKIRARGNNDALAQPVGGFNLPVTVLAIIAIAIALIIKGI